MCKSKKLDDEGSDYFYDIDFLKLVTPAQLKDPFSSNG